MEQQLTEILQAAVTKWPVAMTIYLILSGAYQIFCAVAAWTTTDKDDKLVDKLKLFFSLPIKK